LKAQAIKEHEITRREEECTNKGGSLPERGGKGGQLGGAKPHETPIREHFCPRNSLEKGGRGVMNKSELRAPRKWRGEKIKRENSFFPGKDLSYPKRENSTREAT